MPDQDDASAPVSLHPAARAFNDVAATYQHARPGYPPEAVAHLARALRLSPASRVVELGAGTGKFTEALTGAGLHPVAVEPLPGMLAQLQSRLPGVTARSGTAESIPAADRSVDAVVAAQAFHWFDPQRALTEIARVLVPGGGLGLVWNTRDETTPLWARIAGLLEPHRAGAPTHADGAWRAAIDRDPRYGALRTAVFVYDQPADRDLLVARVASTSFVAALPDRVARELLEQVRAVPDALGLPDTFTLRHRTEVHTTRLVVVGGPGTPRRGAPPG